MFFKKLNEKEKRNSDKASALGFLVYVILLGFTSYQYIRDKELTLSPVFIFAFGIIVALVYGSYLNMKSKRG